MHRPKTKLIIPIWNETESLDQLEQEICKLLSAHKSIDVLLADDGSTDGSVEQIRRMTERHSRVSSLIQPLHRGKAETIGAALSRVNEPYVVLMDADLQYNPQCIPKLIEQLEKGFDGVVGWRRNRNDPYLSRVLPSATCNWMVRLFWGTHVRDIGSGVQAYRRSVLESIPWEGGNHRFISLYVEHFGGRVSQVEVEHRRRAAGQSKYGLNRVLTVPRDLVRMRMRLGAQRQTAH